MPTNLSTTYGGHFTSPHPTLLSGRPGFGVPAGPARKESRNGSSQHFSRCALFLARPFTASGSPAQTCAGNSRWSRGASHRQWIHRRRTSRSILRQQASGRDAGIYAERRSHRFRLANARSRRFEFPRLHPRRARQFFSVRWTGQLIPRFSETYTFRTTSNDGVRLWIKPAVTDSRLELVHNWDTHAVEENIRSIALTSGRTNYIRMDYSAASLSRATIQDVDDRLARVRHTRQHRVPGYRMRSIAMRDRSHDAIVLRPAGESWEQLADLFPGNTRRDRSKFAADFLGGFRFQIERVELRRSTGQEQLQAATCSAEVGSADWRRSRPLQTAECGKTQKVATCRTLDRQHHEGSEKPSSSNSDFGKSVRDTMGSWRLNGIVRKRMDCAHELGFIRLQHLQQQVVGLRTRFRGHSSQNGECGSNGDSGFILGHVKLSFESRGSGGSSEGQKLRRAA